jgi:superfamily I DNA/RNA helicase
VPEYAAAFWVFRTDEAEAEWLANFIAYDIVASADEGRGPDDFVLLVRVRADQAEAQLQEALTARGLRLRNEARLVNGIAIQDLMSDDFASLLLSLIRLALGIRGHDVYGPVQETLGALLGVDSHNPTDALRLEKTVRGIIRVIQEITVTSPANTDLAALVGAVVAEIGEAPLRRTFRQYENDAYFRDVQTALANLMAEYAPTAGDWKQLVDGVEGKGQVQLMIIHKSKGLEYHTVIFFGLHQNAFFGYRNNRAEETNAFFVALSRAKERVFFTRSKESGDIAEIQGLIDLLSRADVPFVEIG